MPYLYRKGQDSGTGAVARVHIDVVGDEKIELAVAIVIDEGTAGIPALAFGGNAGFGGDIGERAVAIVVVEDVFAEVGNEEIVEAVVLVLADAHGLSPAGMNEASLRGDIREGGVAIIFVQAIGGLLASGKAFQARAVHQKNIEPAIVVGIVESDATTGGLQQIFVFMLAAKNRFGVEASFLRNVDEVDAERRGGRGLRRRFGAGVLEKRPGFERPSQRKNIFEGENQSRAAERLTHRKRKKQNQAASWKFAEAGQRM